MTNFESDLREAKQNLMKLGEWSPAAVIKIWHSTSFAELEKAIEGYTPKSSKPQFPLGTQWERRYEANIPSHAGLGPSCKPDQFL